MEGFFQPPSWLRTAARVSLAVDIPHFSSCSVRSGATFAWVFVGSPQILESLLFNRLHLPNSEIYRKDRQNPRNVPIVVMVSHHLAGAQRGMRNGMTPIHHPTGGFLEGAQSLGSFHCSFPTYRTKLFVHSSHLRKGGAWGASWGGGMHREAS